ncbi:YdeI/OmpD-associated family protein [Gordonia sp. (in: high G+C Gram-positive bacteria)]|uniref:YdeI/OmpD-associated family protein n=1 Tax=Gordonia sp. (in: high G+C Gram-positive bacteria) TaxID=84139 RepID=UPI003C71F42D
MDRDGILAFTDGDEWEAWLDEHHADRSDAWLRIAKSRSAMPGLTIGDALDGALCFGWIDGQRRANDDDSFLQRYSPRRATSSWSKINVGKFEALAAAGRVRPAGFAEVERAMADGRWDAAYESQRTAEPPDDLVAALAASPMAASAFDALGRSDRYAIILEILKARTLRRRAEVIGQAVVSLAATRACP